MGLIAVIPARRNSKGIRYKNRLKINGESITRLAIKKAISFNCEYVVLTSDDNYLCKENQDLAYVIKRPSLLSGDQACSFKVWQHALSTLIKDVNINDIDYSSILLEPTSPNRKIEDLQRANNLHHKYNCNVLTLSKLKKSFSPEKIMKVGANSNTTFYKKDGINFLRRQKIKDYYFRNGICYISKVSNILKKDPKTSFYKNCKSIIIQRNIVNIYETDDLQYLLK